MQISELIEQLNEIKKSKGDVSIHCWSSTQLGKTSPIQTLSQMGAMDDSIYLVTECNPNWPSKTGNPSGKQRGNNQ